MEKLARRFAIITLTMTIFAFTVSALVLQQRREAGAIAPCPSAAAINCLAAL